MTPRKILVFRVGQLGDTLVSLPALWALRDNFPEAALSLLYDRHIGRSYVLAADLVGPTGLFDRMFAYPVSARRSDKPAVLLGLARLFLRLRRERFDLAVNLSPAGKTPAQVARDHRFFRACGIPRQITTTRHREEPAAIRPLPYLQPEADFLLSCLGREGLRIPPAGEGRMDLCLNEADRKEAMEVLGPAIAPGRLLLGVGPGSKMQAKRWPVDRFGAVVRTLVRDFKVTPVIFGGPEDQEAGDRILAEAGAGVNAAGRLSLRASVAGLEQCRLYLGNDTGTMHLAAAAGTPCVAVFSARDYPGKWYPYGQGHRVHRVAVECEGCKLYECIEMGRKCLMAISADEVLASCRQLLVGPDPHPGST